METVQALDVESYIKKINKVEAMLEEIKKGLCLLTKSFRKASNGGKRT